MCLVGLEPTTLALKERYSRQLSYRHKIGEYITLRQTAQQSFAICPYDVQYKPSLGASTATSKNL